MMRFTNIVKGQVTQILVKTLFERVGYRVTRLGVEELFYEVVHLDAKAYANLKLPENLRFLPDFLIAEPDISKAFLLEVKFRKKLDINSAKTLYATLSKQRKYWPDSYCILILGESPVKGGRFHQDYMRIITPEKLDFLNPDIINSPFSENEPRDLRYSIKYIYRMSGWNGIWDCLSPLYDTFHCFTHNNPESYLSGDLLTTTIQDLNKL